MLERIALPFKHKLVEIVFQGGLVSRFEIVLERIALPFKHKLVEIVFQGGLVSALSGLS